MGFQISLGSSDANHVVLKYDGISRRHLEIDVHSYEKAVIRDLDSTYGSYYYDNQSKTWQRFRQVTLPLESFIRIGDTNLYLLEIIIARRIQLKT